MGMSGCGEPPMNLAGCLGGLFSWGLRFSGMLHWNVTVLKPLVVEMRILAALVNRASP
jgi:hypothetical protein